MMLRQELRQKVTIPPEQIQTYYDAHQDEFTVKQEKTQARSDPGRGAAERLAGRGRGGASQGRRARKKAIDGEDFAELAASYSDDDSKSAGRRAGRTSPPTTSWTDPGGDRN